MGKHSVPKGEKSSWGQSNGSPGSDGYVGKRRGKETTTSDTKRGGDRDSRLRIPRWLGGK